MTKPLRIIVGIVGMAICGGLLFGAGYGLVALLARVFGW